MEPLVTTGQFPSFIADTGDLRPNPWNANVMTPENEAKLDESLKRLGNFKALVVREVPGVAGYEILGGEHRWQSAMRVGMKSILVVNLGPIDDIAAKEITLADNSRYGSDDSLALAELMKDLDLNVLEQILPYGDTDLQSVLDSANIELDKLSIDENFDKDAISPGEDDDEDDLPAKPAKTHTQLRFMVPLADAERVTKIIAQTKSDQGFNHASELVNAGDALVHLLLTARPKSILTEPSAPTLLDVENQLSLLDDITDADGIV